MKQVRVNVTTAVNMAAIRTEKRNGRDVMIVPSATLPDGVIMNNIKYPADEIEKGFMTLNGTLAPFGHPRVNGDYVSASHPDGLAVSYIGAHNENVRRENGRVLVDKVIDVEVANQSPNGKAVMAAINAGKPVHTSTGLLCSLDEPDADDHEHIARDMYFDHDAILLNEEGAATPEQGVGMMVNAKGEQIDVINSTLEQQADEEVTWAAQRLAGALERKQRASETDGFLGKILEAIGLRSTTSQQNESEDTMAGENQNTDLSERVDTLSDTVGKIGETIANAVADAVKPLIDAQAVITANAKAKDDVELAGHVTAIVKANLMDEAAAGELTLNAARALASKAKAGKATGLNASFTGNDAKDEFEGVDLNADLEAK
jgi:hypothetical protein